MLSQLKHKRFFLFFVHRNPHIFPQKKHVIEKIEINNAICLGGSGLFGPSRWRYF